MSVKKYKFVSPGIFVKEIDNSQLPSTPEAIGPLVIGRTARGPGMVPTQINSFSEFVDTFGNPAPGGASDDVWRDNSILAPTYAAYAAQAWLSNNAPINVIRLLGHSHTDKTATGEAGWMTKNSAGTETTAGPASTDGGAYGLFLIASSSTDATGYRKDTSPSTGCLAAIWYLSEGTITLTGTIRGGNHSAGGTYVRTTSSTACLMESSDTAHEFTAEIFNGSGVRTDRITFNFDKSSPKYIRKVFNTNPTLTNATITRTSQQKNYWLGETYERMVLNGDGLGYAGVGAGSSTQGATFGMLLGLAGPDAAGTRNDKSNHRYASQAAQTGWFIGQDLGAAALYNPYTASKLFKVHALESGQWDMHNIKVSITDLAKATNPDSDPYGTFTVLLRKVQDHDGKIQVDERFSNCNLNPNSPNYIARKIGDKYKEFSSTQRRNIEYGQYENNSKFIRIEMNEDLDEGAYDPVLLPFGVFGPPRFKGFSLVSNQATGPAHGVSRIAALAGNSIADQPYIQAFATGSNAINFSAASGSGFQAVLLGQVSQASTVGRLTASFTGSFLYPALAMRKLSSQDGLKEKGDAFFGLSTTKTDSSRVFEGSVLDAVRPLPENLNSKTFSTSLAGDAQLEYSWIFTLDNVVSASAANDGAQYTSGSRAAATSITALGYNSKSGYEALLEFGIDSFTAPLFGGFDGFDISEKDPFRNTGMSSATEFNNYAFNSIKEAIDMVSDPEELDMNLVTIPGVYNSTLTGHLLDTVEDRGDALAIIDLEGDFKPAAENTESFKTRVDNATVATTVNNLRDRSINSSYGASYFPWVQIYDSINDRLVYTPPSVAAMGVISNSERASELWFAPAGFNRGGLTAGAAGIPVVGITQKLTSKQRDSLYDANINPIASFPSEGIVVFGQKTLQVTPSALDRINVRRLLLFLKKRISQIAATILFDQNVQVTWNRFTGEVEPFLRGVKTGLGLSDFKIVLDETTTTPDLVDRNVLYAKIFLKPARAIEYIAIDFNITNTGASFED